VERQDDPGSETPGECPPGKVLCCTDRTDGTCFCSDACEVVGSASEDTIDVTLGDETLDITLAGSGPELVPHRFCPECKKAGLKSTVNRGEGMTCTLGHCGSGHWDENGKYHPPEPCNACTVYYECSRGHSWTEKEGGHW
jgi:hypothetical protein